MTKSKNDIPKPLDILRTLNYLGHMLNRSPTQITDELDLKSEEVVALRNMLLSTIFSELQPHSRHTKRLMAVKLCLEFIEAGGQVVVDPESGAWQKRIPKVLSDDLLKFLNDPEKRGHWSNLDHGVWALFNERNDEIQILLETMVPLERASKILGTPRKHLLGQLDFVMIPGLRWREEWYLPKTWVTEEKRKQDFAEALEKYSRKPVIGYPDEMTEPTR